MTQRTIASEAQRQAAEKMLKDGLDGPTGTALAFTTAVQALLKALAATANGSEREGNARALHAVCQARKLYYETKEPT